MTDDDKALVERLCDEDSYYSLQEKHWCIDHVELESLRLAAANRIEALSAENERLREALERIAANVHAPCARLMTHPDMCRQAYEARAALGEKQ